jgi:hypothetical protein
VSQSPSLLAEEGGLIRWGSDAALVRGLVHARAGRRPFARVQTLDDGKEFGRLAAGAALAEWALLRVEDDHGLELLVATRGAVTLTFENRSEVASWLNHLAHTGELGRLDPVHGRR